MAQKLYKSVGDIITAENVMMQKMSLVLCFTDRTG